MELRDVNVLSPTWVFGMYCAAVAFYGLTVFCAYLGFMCFRTAWNGVWQ